MKKIFLLFILIQTIAFGQVRLTESEMDSVIMPFVKDTTFSGCILIGNMDSIIFKKAYGYANYELKVPNQTNYVFNVASISKHFTGAAILLLALENKLSIKDSLIKYIPNFPNGNNITIENLLTHKSGIQTYNDFSNYDDFKLKPRTLQQVVDWVIAKAKFNEPNGKFMYSNSNYAILAYIVEKVSAQKFEDYLSEHFFEPANMNHTGNFSRSDVIEGRVSNYEKSGDSFKYAPWFDYAFKYGSGSLQTSVEDMYNWFLALYNNKIYDDTFKEKFLTGYDISGGYGYGLGKGSANSTKVAEHEGGVSGVAAYVVYSLEPAYFIFFVSNVTDGNTREARKQIFQFIYDKLDL